MHTAPVIRRAAAVVHHNDKYYNALRPVIIVSGGRRGVFRLRARHSPPPPRDGRPLQQQQQQQSDHPGGGASQNINHYARRSRARAHVPPARETRWRPTRRTCRPPGDTAATWCATRRPSPDRLRARCCALRARVRRHLTRARQSSRRNRPADRRRVYKNNNNTLYYYAVLYTHACAITVESATFYCIIVTRRLALGPNTIRLRRQWTI